MIEKRLDSALKRAFPETVGREKEAAVKVSVFSKLKNYLQRKNNATSGTILKYNNCSPHRIKGGKK